MVGTVSMVCTSIIVGMNSIPSMDTTDHMSGINVIVCRKIKSVSFTISVYTYSSYYNIYLEYLLI